MKKIVLLGAGIAGLLISAHSADVQAKHKNLYAMGTRSGPNFVINTRPNFVYLQDLGFYVSYGSPYDIIFYNDIYYLYWLNHWYYANYYNGPWYLIQEVRLPTILRRYHWFDLRRFRDNEYRRHDRRYWDNQFLQDRHRFERIKPIGPPPPQGGPIGPPPPHGGQGWPPPQGGPGGPPHGGPSGPPPPPTGGPVIHTGGPSGSGGNPPPPPPQSGQNWKDKHNDQFPPPPPIIK